LGEVELNIPSNQIIIRSNIVTYGNSANESITEQIRDEIETMWNEPEGSLQFNGLQFRVVFQVTCSFQPTITDIEVYQNTDPRKNYFRIEEFVYGNISFVDGLGCNSGYFKLDNLYKGSTTAAHEYGHTLGLHHPKYLDIRGEGIPGIMYPRGTLVDAQYQYNSSGKAGDSTNGGTMHPMHRRVKQKDIELLKLEHLHFQNRRAVIGEFTNIYHWNHADIPPEEFTRPPVAG
jgi:hypothetical protein